MNKTVLIKKIGIGKRFKYGFLLVCALIRGQELGVYLQKAEDKAKQLQASDTNCRAISHIDLKQQVLGVRAEAILKFLQAKQGDKSGK